MTIKNLLTRWDKRKWEEIFCLDLRSLGVFRIGIALALLGDLLVRATDLRLFYTDAGVLPRASLFARSPGHWPLSLHACNGTVFFEGLLFLLAAAAGIGLLIGYRTRWMTLVCWFLTSSLHARNFLVLQGGDDYLRMLLFWSLFLPLGARFSVDAALDNSTRAAPAQVYSWGSFAFIMQTVFLYLSTSIFKSRGTDWWDGSALYYALNLDCFAKRPAFMLLLFPGLLKVLTQSVLFYEFLGSFLLVSPFRNGPIRTLGVVGFFFLQLGIFLTMAIGPFQFISMMAVIALLPSWFWERAGTVFGKKARLLRAKFMRAPRVQDGLALLSRLPRSTPASKPYIWSTPVILLALLCVAWWDLSALLPKRIRLPEAISAMCYMVNLKQGWAMFSPNVTKSSGWFVIPGKLADGRIVDLNRGGEPVSWAPPPLISAYFKNERRRKFLMNMRSSKMDDYRGDFSRYLCRSWNDTHGKSEQLQSMEIIFMNHPILPDYAIGTYERQILWDAYCSEEARLLGAPHPLLAAQQKNSTRRKPSRFVVRTKMGTFSTPRRAARPSKPESVGDQ